MSARQGPDSLDDLLVDCLQMCLDGFVERGLVAALGFRQLQAKVVLGVNSEVDWGGDLDPALDGEAAIVVQRVGLEHVLQLQFLDWELLCALTVLPGFEADGRRVWFVEVDIELLVARIAGLGLLHQAILEQLSRPERSKRTGNHHHHRKHNHSNPQAHH